MGIIGKTEDAIMEEASEIIEGLEGFFSGILDKAESGVNQLTKGIEDAVTGAYHTVVDGVTGEVSIIEQTISEDVERVEDWTKNAYQTVSGGIRDEVNSIEDRTKQAVEKTEQAIAGAYDTVTGDLRSAMQMAKGEVEFVEGRIANFTMNIEGKAREIARNIDAFVVRITNETTGYLIKLKDGTKQEVNKILQGTSHLFKEVSSDIMWLGKKTGELLAILLLGGSAYLIFGGATTIAHGASIAGTKVLGASKQAASYATQALPYALLL
jgi:phage-related protein